MQGRPTLPCSLIPSHVDLEPQELHPHSPGTQLLPTSTIHALESVEPQARQACHFQRDGWQAPVPEGSVALGLSPSLYFCLLFCSMSHFHPAAFAYIVCGRSALEVGLH